MTMAPLRDRSLGDEIAAEQDQGDTGDLLRTLAKALADKRAESEPDLARHERQDANRENDRHDRQPGQAKAESDGELVQTDADAQGHYREAVCARDAVSCLLVVVA